MIIKQSLQSRPGPQDRSLLETDLIKSAYVMNNTPYLTEENKEWLAPIDIVTLWNETDVMIWELPDSTLKDLMRQRSIIVQIREFATIAKSWFNWSKQIKKRGDESRHWSQKKSSWVLRCDHGGSHQAWCTSAGVIQSIADGECSNRLNPDIFRLSSFDDLN